MENEPDSGTAAELSSHELLFDELPPLGSPPYLELLKSATPANLPAEVLVRAYRQLPLGSVAGRATLERLVGRSGSRWFYLSLVTHLARQQLENQETQDRAADHEDLMQDAITLIIEVLHGPRGVYAEKSWTAFCYQRFFDAWRDRYGRRGTKLEALAEQISPTKQGDDESEGIDNMATADSVWLGIWDAAGRSARIEGIVEQVMASLDDPLARQVAQALWSGGRPKVSGRGTGGGGPSLMQQFAGQSRDQLHRLIRRIEAALAAALLADESLQWSKEQVALLRKRKGEDK
jgi:hypothetical protein